MLHARYLVTDLAETDLLSVLKSPQILELGHIQYLTYQLLAGLDYLHSRDVVHRDLVSCGGQPCLPRD